jgi:hypothetical protein
MIHGGVAREKRDERAVNPVPTQSRFSRQSRPSRLTQTSMAVPGLKKTNWNERDDNPKELSTAREYISAWDR